MQEGLELAQQNRALVAWVREVMQDELTSIEIDVTELRYYHDLTFREIGDALDGDPSTIFRISRAAILKLRRQLGLES